MSAELVAFLRARADEREAAARQAEESGEETGETFWPSVFGAYNEGYLTKGQANHIGCHDPAWALRYVAAVRAILAEHRQGDGDSVWCHTCDPAADMNDSDRYYPCKTIRLLAAIDAGHPDYQSGWAP